MLSSFFNRSLKFESVHASQKCYFDNDLKRLWNAWLNLNLNFTRLELLFSIIFIQLLPCLFIWCESRLLRPFIVTASLLDLIIVLYLHLKPPLVFYIVLNLRVSSESWFSFTIVFIFHGPDPDLHSQLSSFSMDRTLIFIHNTARKRFVQPEKLLPGQIQLNTFFYDAYALSLMTGSYNLLSVYAS
jgi:hypothetical protein